MLSCFNGDFLETLYINPSTDRGFMYGDGLFESLKVEESRVINFDKHFARLLKGINQLKLSITANFKITIEEQIVQTCQKNKLKNARVKFLVWRDSGGLYTPSNNNINYLITCSELQLNNFDINFLGVASTIKISPNELSNLKTINSLPYILAAIEKKERKLDEILILNTNNKICECSSSNIFWEKDETIYTPSLESGCIAGIAREIEIESYLREKISFKEGLFEVDILKNAKRIWTTNTFGKRKIITIKL